MPQKNVLTGVRFSGAGAAATYDELLRCGSSSLFWRRRVGAAQCQKACGTTSLARHDWSFAVRHGPPGGSPRTCGQTAASARLRSSFIVSTFSRNPPRLLALQGPACRHACCCTTHLLPVVSSSASRRGFCGLAGGPYAAAAGVPPAPAQPRVPPGAPAAACGLGGRLASRRWRRCCSSLQGRPCRAARSSRGARSPTPHGPPPPPRHRRAASLLCCAERHPTSRRLRQPPSGCTSPHAAERAKKAAA